MEKEIFFLLKKEKKIHFRWLVEGFQEFMF
jgi:hypothetical protein